LQGNDLKRLGKTVPQTSRESPEIGFPGALNRKPTRQGQGGRPIRRISIDRKHCLLNANARYFNWSSGSPQEALRAWKRAAAKPRD
jgi:hypothetical protein